MYVNDNENKQREIRIIDFNIKQTPYTTHQEVKFKQTSNIHSVSSFLISTVNP